MLPFPLLVRSSELGFRISQEQTDSGTQAGHAQFVLVQPATIIRRYFSPLCRELKSIVRPHTDVFVFELFLQLKNHHSMVFNSLIDTKHFEL